MDVVYLHLCPVAKPGARSSGCSTDCQVYKHVHRLVHVGRGVSMRDGDVVEVPDDLILDPTGRRICESRRCSQP